MILQVRQAAQEDYWAAAVGVVDATREAAWTMRGARAQLAETRWEEAQAVREQRDEQRRRGQQAASVVVEATRSRHDAVIKERFVGEMGDVLDAFEEGEGEYPGHFDSSAAGSWADHPYYAGAGGMAGARPGGGGGGAEEVSTSCGHACGGTAC